MQRFASALVCLTGVILCSPAAALAQAPSSWKQRLVVETIDGAPLDFVTSEHGWQDAGAVVGLGLHSFGDDGSGLASEKLLEALGLDPNVAYVALDGAARSPEDCDVFDPYSVQQCTIGFLDGQSSQGKYDAQSWMSEYGILEVQSKVVGAPQLVAVIDSGLDLGHPVFAGRLASEGWDYVLSKPGAWDVPNGTDEDGDGFVDEAFGHGTHVASLIALVDPNALLLPYRVVDADGRGWAFDVAQAVVQATLDGADVINLSLSVEPHSEALRTAIEFALLNGADVISSAGNSGQDEVLFPASMEHKDIQGWIKMLAPHGVVAVAALGEEGQMAAFSSHGKQVDLAAPGVDLYGALPGGQWGWWSGTSMATAVVSGSASLLRSTSQLSSWVPADVLLVDVSAPLESPTVSEDNEEDEELEDAPKKSAFGRLDLFSAYLANPIP